MWTSNVAEGWGLRDRQCRSRLSGASSKTMETNKDHPDKNNLAIYSELEIARASVNHVNLVKTCKGGQGSEKNLR